MTAQQLAKRGVVTNHQRSHEERRMLCLFPRWQRSPMSQASGDTSEFSSQRVSMKLFFPQSLKDFQRDVASLICKEAYAGCDSWGKPKSGWCKPKQFNKEMEAKLLKGQRFRLF